MYFLVDKEILLFANGIDVDRVLPSIFPWYDQSIAKCSIVYDQTIDGVEIRKEVHHC